MMEECLSESFHESSFLAVPCPGVGIKARSYSDTSIFKNIPEKNRSYSHSEEDNCRLSSPPKITTAGSIEGSIDRETSTLKTKRKNSRQRSPFNSEKAFDIFSKFTKNDIVAKVTASSPKLLARRARSKTKDSECRETVSSNLKFYSDLTKFLRHFTTLIVHFVFFSLVIYPSDANIHRNA